MTGRTPSVAVMFTNLQMPDKVYWDFLKTFTQKIGQGNDWKEGVGPDVT